MEPPVVQIQERPPLHILAPLSVQHLLAMFGATVLVPVVLGVDPATVLLFNGIGTLIFLVLCKWKVPAYLGSSFAFLPPSMMIIATYGYGAALAWFIASGIFFLILGLLIYKTGTGWVDIVFPEAAMGAIVTIIGLELAPSAGKMAGFTSGNPDITTIGIVVVTLAVMIVGMTVCRGFLRVIPILLGLVAGSIVSLILGQATFDTVISAPWFSVPTLYTPVFSVPAILIILPASIVTFVELIGHMKVTGTIVGKDLMNNPGIVHPLLVKGISTIISGFFGSTPNTTYAENIGVLAITRVYSTYVLAGTACIAIAISFCGKVPAAINSIPPSVMGAVALFLFGVIAASGIRMLIDAKTDLSKPRNLVFVSLILVVGVSGASIGIGSAALSGMALATLIAMLLGGFFFAVDKLRPE